MKPLPIELQPYRNEIIQGNPENKEGWILYPTEENWERDTEIYWSSGYNIKTYNEECRHIPNIELKNQHTMMVSGMLTGFTRPFKIYQDKNGDFVRFGDHPLLEEKEAQLKPRKMSRREWKKLIRNNN